MQEIFEKSLPISKDRIWRYIVTLLGAGIIAIANLWAGAFIALLGVNIIVAYDFLQVQKAHRTKRRRGKSKTVRRIGSNKSFTAIFLVLAVLDLSLMSFFAGMAITLRQREIRSLVSFHEGKVAWVQMAENQWRLGVMSSVLNKDATKALSVTNLQFNVELDVRSVADTMHHEIDAGDVPYYLKPGIAVPVKVLLPTDFVPIQPGALDINVIVLACSFVVEGVKVLTQLEPPKYLGRMSESEWENK